MLMREGRLAIEYEKSLLEVAKRADQAQDGSDKPKAKREHERQIEGIKRVVAEALAGTEEREI